MAGTDPQKQLLTQIRDFATEKSQGDVQSGEKSIIQELRSELDLVNAELEDAKRLKETAEQDLKGYEVELARNEASIQTLEARISLIQDKISNAGSDLEALKVQVELIDLERQVFLMEAIAKESIELQDLIRQTYELEEKIASLGQELQRRCMRPSSHVDNTPVLIEIVQASDVN